MLPRTVLNCFKKLCITIYWIIVCGGFITASVFLFSHLNAKAEECTRNECNTEVPALVVANNNGVITFMYSDNVAGIIWHNCTLNINGGAIIPVSTIRTIFYSANNQCSQTKEKHFCKEPIIYMSIFIFFIGVAIVAGAGHLQFWATASPSRKSRKSILPSVITPASKDAQVIPLKT
jgi:hypothetical protein